MPDLISVSDVVNDLQGEAVVGGYLIYGQTISSTTIQSQVDYAIDYIYLITGSDRLTTDFLGSTDTHLQNLPKRAAIKLAAGRLINRMMGNIMSSDFSVSIDGLNINKSNYPQILQNMKDNLKEEYEQLIMMLRRPAVVVNQHATDVTQAGITLRQDSTGMLGSSSWDPFTES